MKALNMKTKPTILLIVFLLLFPVIIYARTEIDGELDWFYVIIGLIGGLAFFLFGMEKMSEGLKKVAGDGMRRLLAVLSKNRVIGLFVGAFVTMFIQSSSATTVMLVSFVNFSLIKFAQTFNVSMVL